MLRVFATFASCDQNACHHEGCNDERRAYPAQVESPVFVWLGQQVAQGRAKRARKNKRCPE